MAETGLNQPLKQAQQLQAQGRIAEAEQTLKQAAENGAQREAALSTLAEIYLQSGRPGEAGDLLTELMNEYPDQPAHYIWAASLFEAVGKGNAAIDCYLRLLSRRPDLPSAHYNLALLYKKQMRFHDALRSYEQAVQAGIERAEEVYSNMGVLYSELRQASMARRMYERALKENPGYVPAMFNLAGLMEEAGDRHGAEQLYRCVLTLNPGFGEALARIAYMQKASANDTTILDSLRAAIAGANDDNLGREALYFAQGKVLDDLGLYEEAFASFQAANALVKARDIRYDRNETHKVFRLYREWFSPERIEQLQTASKARPIFICGMFRSGTTLMEQILGRHSAVSPGGELEYFPWLIGQRLSPFPRILLSKSREELEQVGNEYLALVGNLCPDAENITDKRPDNFHYLGIIKILFPRARIIYMRRNAMDNCLSIFFQHLGGWLRYSTDLEDIAHYYREHDQLMRHWRACLGSDIFKVSYEELVQSSEPVLRRLLNFLDLPWDEACLGDRQAGDNLVKTPSVWQVREGLYTDSAGRWRNYEPYLADLKAALGDLFTE